MPEPDDEVQWDLYTLIDGWILIGLPVLLAIVAVAVLIYNRTHRETNTARDSLRIVRRIGLIHCALFVQAAIFLTQQLLALRTMGNPESHFSMAVGLITTTVNPLLAIGLLCSSPTARRLALVWYAFLSVIGLMAAAWLYYYGVHIDLLRWPEQIVASKILPVFLFGVVLVPRIKQVFATRPPLAHPNEGTGSPNQAAAVAASSAVSPILSLAELLFLIVVCSNLVVDAIDWVYRLAFTPESIP